MTDPSVDGPQTGSAVRVWQPVRCQAHTSSGRECKRWAIQGGFVCPTHGGSAPQVRQAANRRLLALAPRAVQVLADLLEHSDSDVVRLRAATELLDRGIGKAVDVTLDITPQDDSSGPSPLDLAISRALEVRGLGSGDQVVTLEPGEDGVYVTPDQGEHTPAA